MFLEKIASVLAIVIGIMTIFVSTKAMRGWQPGWKVIPWLPVYNFVMGILSLVPAALLWINHHYALTASLITFGIHAIVLLLLLTFSVTKLLCKAPVPWVSALSYGSSSLCCCGFNVGAAP